MLNPCPNATVAPSFKFFDFIFIDISLIFHQVIKSYNISIEAVASATVLTANLLASAFFQDEPSFLNQQ